MNKIELIKELVELHCKKFHLDPTIEERIHLYNTFEEHLKHIEYKNSDSKFQVYNKIQDYVFTK